MDPYADLLAPHSLEVIRRGLVLNPDRPAQIGRDRALALIEELERLRHAQAEVAAKLRGLLTQVEATERRPGG